MLLGGGADRHETQDEKKKGALKNSQALSLAGGRIEAALKAGKLPSLNEPTSSHAPSS